MFGTLFGKATALSEVGDAFRARCKAAAQRQVSDADTMNSAISEKLGHVEDCIAVTEKAIKLQKDGIAELQKKKATPVEQRDPKSRLARLKAHHRTWAAERKALLLERYLPGGDHRWLLRTQAEEGIYLGLRDLRLDDFGARFDVRAGAGWLMVELSEGQVGISIEHFALRGSSASIRLLSAFLSPEAVEFSLKIKKLVIPCVWQKVPDVEWIEGQPTHRWRVDEENMGIELSFEKSIRGAATAPDALIEWIAKKLFPEIMRQVTLLLPDELGEFLQMGSLHWLCAGQLSLQTTVSRAIWSAPLAADTPESKLARQLLNIDQCHALVFMLNDWCTRGPGASEFNGPVSLRSIYAFYMRYAGDDAQSIAEWASIVVALQEAVAIWEVEVRKSESPADRSVAARLAQLRTTGTASSSRSVPPQDRFFEATVISPEHELARESISSFSNISPPIKPPAPVVEGTSKTGFFGSLFFSCCSSAVEEPENTVHMSSSAGHSMERSAVSSSPSKSDVEFTTQFRGSVSARPAKGGKAAAAASSAAPVASASSNQATSDWFHDILRRVVDVGKQHMRLTLRLSRFDLQLDISSLLDLAARLLNRLQLLSQSAAKTAQAARDAAALGPSSPRSLARSPTQNSESMAAAETTSQLLVNLPQFVRGILQQIDHVHSSFTLELLGASDCHLDCTLDDVALQARAPVAHFLLDPTESSVSAPMPGMEVDFRFTPEDLLQMSWHVAERQDMPRVFKDASQLFPSQVSMSFLVGGVQLLMLPCKLRRRTTGTTPAAPTANAQQKGREKERAPSDAAAALMRQMTRGAISMGIARLGIALPVWPAVAQQWPRFFVGTAEQELEWAAGEETSSIKLKLEPEDNGRVKRKGAGQTGMTPSKSPKSSNTGGIASFFSLESDHEQIMSILKSLDSPPVPYKSPLVSERRLKSIASVFGPFVLDPVHKFLISATLDFTLTVHHAQTEATVAELQEQRGMIRSKGNGPFTGRPEGRSNSDADVPAKPDNDEAAYLSLSTKNDGEFFDIDFVFHLQDLIVDLQSIAEAD